MAKTFLALIVCLCLALPVAAQSTVSTPGTAAPGKTGSKKPVRPAWSELKPAQQKVLAPLAPEWDKMDSTRRKKWVTIADRYPKMKPQEQQRLQTNMVEWVKLTPEQRKAARDKYQTIKKLPPQKRQEVKNQWRQYQQSLARQQRQQGAPLEPSLTDPAEPASTTDTPALQTPVAATPSPSQ